MRLKAVRFRFVLLLIAVIAAAFLLWQTGTPDSSKDSEQPGHPTASHLRATPPAPAAGSGIKPAGESTINQAVRQLADMISERLHMMDKTGTVEFGAIMDDLDKAGVKNLNAKEILSALDLINFGSPSDSSQGSRFVLEAMAEVLRDKALVKDVIWVGARFEQAATLAEEAKWRVVLGTIGHTGNQAAYIQMLNSLSAEIGDQKQYVKADLIGMVLGRIGSGETVRAILAAANDPDKSRQLAAQSAVGYVQSTEAISAIAEVLDGLEPPSNRQIVLATRMLGHIPSEYSVQSLKNLAADPDPENAHAAAEALSQLIKNNPGLNAIQK